MPARSSPADYYQALFGAWPAIRGGGAETTRVTLHDGSELVLRRGGLGVHSYLQYLAQLLNEAALEQRVAFLGLWLEVAGMDVSRLAVKDLPPVVTAIRKLNAGRGRAPWSDQVRRPANGTGLREREHQATTVDYPGRALAFIVDLLARHYGWRLAEVLALSPEAAMLHVVECLLAAHREREWQHALSEVAYEYDKASHKMHYRPLPALPWSRPAKREYEPVPEWVKEKYYPKGLVIDLTDPGSVKRLGGTAGLGE